LTPSKENNQHFNFTDSEKVENILSKYPDKRSATLPLLHLLSHRMDILHPVLLIA